LRRTDHRVATGGWGETAKGTNSHEKIPASGRPWLAKRNRAGSSAGPGRFCGVPTFRVTRLGLEARVGQRFFQFHLKSRLRSVCNCPRRGFFLREATGRSRPCGRLSTENSLRAQASRAFSDHFDPARGPYGYFTPFQSADARGAFADEWHHRARRASR